MLSQSSSSIYRHGNRELSLDDIIVVGSNDYGTDAFIRRGRVSEDQFLSPLHREEATEATVKRKLSESRERRLTETQPD